MARQKAIKRAKRNKKIAIIAAAVVCAIIAIVILWNAVIIPAQKKRAFVDTYSQAVYDKFGFVEKGAYITLGKYEQDADASNGKEAVEWLVLDVVDGKALVISRYALDKMRYNNSYTDVTWETCTLRQWLNNDFLNEAFSAEELALIPTVTVSADQNPECKTNPGNATQDRVFVLSSTEATRYFDSDNARQCEPTDFAITNGAHANADTGSCFWWLRTSGYGQKDAVDVTVFGAVNNRGASVNYGYAAVRPALWIDLSAVQ